MLEKLVSYLQICRNKDSKITELEAIVKTNVNKDEELKHLKNILDIIGLPYNAMYDNHSVLLANLLQGVELESVGELYGKR